jgi:iron complex outermembrane receptor protein
MAARGIDGYRYRYRGEPLFRPLLVSSRTLDGLAQLPVRVPSVSYWATPTIPFLLAALLPTITPPTTGVAQTKEAQLAQVSIEDLMNIEITSVSHKEQRAVDVAAAVSVITQEDIRRSGMTTVPELLRLVPGVQVARINSNKWAVTIRGFNNLFADKLLVLIDGRTVYDRLNSGVFWESVDVPLDQIERIEVIRGPGGATWGANAVNGVINIVTTSAADLPGGAVSVAGGMLDGVRTAARYGGTLGRVAYRVYSQWAGRGESLIDAETPAHDSWQSQTHGVRLDWSADRDAFMVEGGATLGRLRALWRPIIGPVPAVKPIPDDLSRTYEYNALGRWTHRRTTGASLQVQSFVDFRRNVDPVSPSQTLADIDAQYHTAMGGRHDLVVGVGHRHVDEHVAGGFTFALIPDHVTETVVNAFAQDEIALGRRVKVTLGTKVERESSVGWGVQPTARVMWTLAPRQHVWAAVSRALRTPSLGELLSRQHLTSFVGDGGLPVVVGALGNAAQHAERVVSTEAGYRREIGSFASIDATAFVGRYNALKTAEPGAPHLEATPAPVHLFIPAQCANLLDATASGVEIAAHWTPTGWWRLDGGYSTFRLTPHLSATSGDTAAASFDGNAPRAQWQARSAFSLAHGVELDVMVFQAGRLSTLQIDAYTRTDARLEVPLTQRLSLSVAGQNLFDRAHAEFAGDGAIVTPTLVPRSGSINVVWRSRS